MKHTEIIFLVDSSGSMAHLTKDTIGGFNGFVESQKDDTKTTLTTVLFNTSMKTLHDGVDVYEVSPMTNKDYIAGGGTALLDAIGETIERVQNRHDNLGVEKPDNVLFVITTDGEENSSRKFNKAKIQKMIKHQENGHGWTFMFLGANMDAVTEAASLGISSNHAVSYDYSVRGTDAIYTTMSATATASKCCTDAAFLNSIDLASEYADSLAATYDVDGSITAATL